MVILKDKIESFLKEFKELQEKYGIFVDADYREIIDYDWEESPYVSGVETFLSFYDKGENKIGELDWENEFIQDENYILVIEPDGKSTKHDV